MVELLTLTLRHELGDDLGELNRARQRAWRIFTAGKPWKRLATRLGVAHVIRGTDDTHGAAGWHPHLHVLLFTRPPAEGARARARLLTELRHRWARAVRKSIGPDHVPNWRGVDLRPCRKDEYVTKLGLELVAPNTKRARRGGATPWDIASSAAAGDQTAAVLWVGYTKAMKGVRQLTWSRGLRVAAALEAEKTDQQIIDGVDDDAAELHVASIPAAIWDEISGHAGALFAIKRAAESGGVLAVAATIALYRWGLAPPDDGEPPDPFVLELAREIAPSSPVRRLELVA
jgi:hypothetical protein